MKTLYLKRKQTHTSDMWGIQVTCCQTDLIRATTVGGSYFDTKRPMRVIFEWVGCGQRIEGAELERLMRHYPVAEFQSDEDLAWRAMRPLKPHKGGSQ